MDYKFATHLPPFAHQREGLKRIIADGGVHALLWDMGVGKGRTVVDYACLLAQASHRAGKGPVRVLVICPKEVQTTWVQQFSLFTPPGTISEVQILRGSIASKAQAIAAFDPQPTDQPSVAVLVTNLESFSSRLLDGKSKTITLADRMTTACQKVGFHLLVCDELHRLKAHNGNASRCIRRIARHIPRRLGLTGTPLPHSPMDAWAEWAIIDPTTFATPNGDSWGWSKFRDTYAIMGGFYGKEVIGFKELADFEDRIARRSSVVRKADALDLPPTLDVEHYVELTPPEHAAYEDMRKNLLAKLDSGQLTAVADNRLTQLLRLRQITSGYLGIEDAHGLRSVADLGPGKRKAARSLLDDLMLSERRVVVFCWGRHEIERLTRELREDNCFSGVRIEVITGDTPDAERERIKADFGPDSSCPDIKIILICQIRTISVGVNELVTASHALYLSLTQLREDYEQSKARLDRSGQTLPVTFHHFLVKDSVDTVILANHRSRGNLEAALLQHVRDVRNGGLR